MLTYWLFWLDETLAYFPFRYEVIPCCTHVATTFAKKRPQNWRKGSNRKSSPKRTNDEEEDTQHFQVQESQDWNFCTKTQRLERYGSANARESFPDAHVSGLSQFIFLDPKWLAATMGCILRHDLRNQIDETRYLIDRKMHPSPQWQFVGRGNSLHDANKNCPIITTAETIMLWKARKKIVKAAERSTLDSNASVTRPFKFMQELLIHFSVFVPIDVFIDKVSLGGQNFSTDKREKGSSFFFLPSQLGPWEPSDKTWTFKCFDSWKVCLCHSWLFPDGSPPGLFEHITASILRDLYAVTNSGKGEESFNIKPPNSCWHIGKIVVCEILCWRTALNIIIGKIYQGDDGEPRESKVEVWVHLVDQESPYCVAGEHTGVGMRRLIVSGKGEEGNGCRKIWQGGYELILIAVERVVEEYQGLPFVKQGICPDCLASRDIRLAQ